MYDGDWVKAKGTTLGRRQWTYVAAIMSILEIQILLILRLEALFTIDEEKREMTGALGLNPVN